MSEQTLHVLYTTPGGSLTVAPSLPSRLPIDPEVRVGLVSAGRIHSPVGPAQCNSYRGASLGGYVRVVSMERSVPAGETDALGSI